MKLQFVYSGLIALVTSFILISCGSENNTAQNNPSPVKTISGVKYTESVAKDGTNRLLFENALPGGNAKNKVGLEFSLSDGGSLTVSLNVTKQLDKGINFEFTRVKNTLRVQVTGSKRTKDLSAEVGGKLGAIDGKMRVLLRVHNDEGDSHVILADMNGKKIAEIDEVEGPGRGQGTFWIVGQKGGTLVSLPIVPEADKE
jgi:hypothetical protein